ncbi:integrase [Comamonas thiooxydans]|uniref:integrase n=1 Tax=Comamonas thiooxydans TaxID=363952 RepID=UPI003CFE403A
MSRENQARVHTIPVLRLTRVRGGNFSGGIPVEYVYKDKKVEYVREEVLPGATRWTQFRSIPAVLDDVGKPWAEACLWVLEKAQLNPRNIDSLKPIAQDLASYKIFLDDLGIDWRDFSAVEKYARPTYLYKTHLQALLNDGLLKKSTASRRMSSVIGFYRFLMRNPRMRFLPSNDPWVERDIGIAYLDGKGFKQIATVTSTDVSIKTSRDSGTADDGINDGGKLRPLPPHEQQMLIAALKEIGNVEYTLMHYMALLMGAREMTVLTFRLRDVMCPADEIPQWPHKIRCGPGTGIDTKGNVAGVYLSMPRMLYEDLHAYATSQRAIRRRSRTARGEDPSNYLFLTQHGQPYYESKEDRNALQDTASQFRRSVLSGRPLRKFIAQSVIPTVRKTYPNFTYRFHDIRATFGMNWVDFHMLQVGTEGIGKRYLWARDQLKNLMWHKSPHTTDRYIEYRDHMQSLHLSRKDWSDHLLTLIKGEI